MNKKPIHTDFLNLQWKPAPMFYGFKPNVRPYILPHNRGKLPMPNLGTSSLVNLLLLIKQNSTHYQINQNCNYLGKFFIQSRYHNKSF